MDIISDLQIHSKYARATSKNISIENLEKYGRIKGINLLGVGDFQHPLRRKEIDEKLTEDDKGILRTKTGFPFIWQTEVSLMYSQDGKRRAVHHLIFAPNTEVANQVTEFLGSRGRLDYDGRPIFGMTSPELVENLKKISDKIEIIPAHCLLPNDKIICNSSVKEISDLDVGDKVLSHTGNYQKVKEVLVSPYKGKIFTITPYYFRESPLNVTENHPVLAIKTIKDCSFIGGLCKPNSIAKGHHKCTKKHYESYKSKWIFAKDLEVNDVLLYPRINKIDDKKFIKISEFIDKGIYRMNGNCLVSSTGRQDKKIKNKLDITPDFCRLIGYYLAEGYVVKKSNCVQFSFAKHEKRYIDDVTNLMKNCFGIPLTKKRERHGCDLHFYSKILTEFFEKLFYDVNEMKRSYSKKIPQWMLYLPKEKQAELFRGWWRGDAGVTNSEILANQMKLICLRLGIVPSIYKMAKEKHKDYGSKIGERKIIASHDCFFLQNLSFYEDNFNLLEEKEFKRFKTKLQRKHGWIDENYVYIPIRKISVNDYSGEVYNLEVENDESYVTPSAIVHNCMTPWFGLFGSKSGFDSIKECFQDQAKHIYAVESGISADPGMLWRFDEIAKGKVNVVSFSDAHSHWPWRLGREATIFDLPEMSYEGIINSIRTGQGLKSTIETPPEYGKYHWDGHRVCDFSCNPEETKKLNGKCPKCGKSLIIGVDYRVEEVAAHEQGFKPDSAKPFLKLLPLHELISLHTGNAMQTKTVWQIYNNMIKEFGNEFNILLNIPLDKLAKNFNERLADLIIKNREQKIKVKPGYDGVYGQALLGEKQGILT